MDFTGNVSLTKNWNDHIKNMISKFFNTRHCQHNNLYQYLIFFTAQFIFLYFPKQFSISLKKWIKWVHGYIYEK